MRYPWLVFDADNTLFDFTRAERHALARTFGALGIAFDAAAQAAFHEINARLWRLFERGGITTAELRVRRFADLAGAMGYRYDASAVGRIYLDHLGDEPGLLDGAEALVTSLAATRRIAIATNGITEVQRRRVAASPIGTHVAALVISDEVGAAKPDARFFDALFAALGQPARHEVLMVGDSLSSDIAGAAAYGVDTAWFNPRGTENGSGVTPTYELRRLAELEAIIR